MNSEEVFCKVLPWDLMVVGVVSVIGVGVREECIYRETIQNIVAKKHANSVKGIWINRIHSTFPILCKKNW